MAIPNTVLRNAIAAMATQFDTHELIRKIMKRNPRDYVMHLYAFVNTPDPIQQGHADIGRQLAQYPGLQKVSRPSSGNVRGGENDNQLWRK